MSSEDTYKVQYPDLMEAYLQSVLSALGAHGFERVLQRASFHRATPFGWQGVQITFVEHRDGSITLRFAASIRFDSVERAVVSHSGPLYRDGVNRATLAIFLQSLCTIDEASQIAAGVTWTMRCCEDEALPFFRNFPDLEAACVALNTLSNVNDKFDFPSDHERAKRVIACAIALGHRTDLTSLIEEQRERLSKQPGAILNEFENFVQSLLRGSAI